MVILAVFIFGIVIGSFLNVCIYRIPLGRSIVWPSSYCPSCGKNIHPLDNIPLLSFVILRGKCRHCGVRIPLRYFAVELLTGLCGVLLFTHFPEFYDFLKYWIFACILITIFFIDLEHQIVPDVLSLSGTVCGLVLLSFTFSSGEINFLQSSFFDSLLGALAGGLCIFIMGTVGEIIFRREAVGGGDLKLMAMIGAFLGWKMALLVFFMAPVLGTGFALFAKIKKKAEVIAYAPYLAAAAMISLLYGDEILRYLFPIF